MNIMKMLLENLILNKMERISYWLPAMYFILFEFIFWMMSEHFGIFIQNLYFYGEIINFDYKIILSFLGILISIWCFKQFVKYLVIILKQE